MALFFSYQQLQKTKAKKEAQEKEVDNTVVLSKVDKTKAVKIKIQNIYGEATLIKEEEQWKIEKALDIPMNQTSIETMVEDMALIQSTRMVVDKNDNLEEYGLQEPSIKVIMELKDNSQITLLLGKEAPVVGGYYGRVESKKGVYLIDKEVYSHFLYSENQLVSTEDSLNIQRENITQVKVENRKGQDFLLQKTSEKVDPWEIQKPYKIKVKADTSGVNILLENYIKYDFTQCMDYTGANLSTYGLKEPTKTVQIQYQDKDKKDRNYVLKIGKEDGNGHYFVQHTNSPGVYLMEEKAVDTLTEVKVFEYVDKTFCDTTVESLKTLTITSEGKKDIWKITKEKDAYHVTKDGKDVAETDFRQDFEKLSGLEVQGEIKKTNSKNEPVIQIDLQGLKNTTIGFLPYDEKFFRLNVNGLEYFLVNKKTVEEMVAGFKK